MLHALLLLHVSSLSGIVPRCCFGVVTVGDKHKVFKSQLESSIILNNSLYYNNNKLKFNNTAFKIKLILSSV